MVESDKHLVDLNNEMHDRKYEEQVKQEELRKQKIQENAKKNLELISHKQKLRQEFPEIKIMDKITTTEMMANQKKKLTEGEGGMTFGLNSKKFRDD